MSARGLAIGTIVVLLVLLILAVSERLIPQVAVRLLEVLP